MPSLLALLLAAFPAACAGGDRFPCEELCACERCTDKELDECVDESHDAERRAEDSGCGEPYRAYLACVRARAVCDQQTYNYEPCLPKLDEVKACEHVEP